MDSYQRGYADGMTRKPSQAEQQFTEGNMLTNADLKGDLNLIWDYNRKKRELEAEFSERSKRLDAEFQQKTGKVAGDELDKLTVAKMKLKPELTYSAAFSEVQQENPKLTQQYVEEL